ncbi:hypothetical protein H2203_006384 [Taxawa tesnikishii (nom. ined.)]|nr:hypothetical protein H2203_006384 [Dothideales sp. JES 119]
MHARKRLKNIGRLNVTSIVANRVLRKNLLDNSVHLLSPFKTPGRVVLVLILNPGVNVLPDHASFEMLWSWMHGADLYYMDLPSSNLEEIALPTDSFFDLVNLYAAAGIISLQPTPRYIESAVFQYISDNPLSAAEIKTIWDRVPKTDRVFAHIAHNYYHHLQAGRISLEEEEAIWAYTERIPDLSQIFLDVERIRDQKKVETEEKEEFGTPQQTHQQRRRNRGRRATVPRAPSQS